MNSFCRNHGSLQQHICVSELGGTHKVRRDYEDAVGGGKSGSFYWNHNELLNDHDGHLASGKYILSLR